MRALEVGERLDLQRGMLELKVSSGKSALGSDISAQLVALSDMGGLAPQFPPLCFKDREQRPGARFDEAGLIHLDLASMPPDVHRLLVVLYLNNRASPGTTLSSASDGALRARIGNFATFSLAMDRRDDAATILIEVYRRGATWRVYANGQGFAFGLSAIARALNAQLPLDDAYSGARVSDPVRDQNERIGPRLRGAASGSAFAIGPRLLLTNHHVIESASHISVAGVAGGGRADLLLADPVNDIALLRIHHDAAAFARFRSSGDVDLGEDIIVAGFPLQGLLGTGPQVSGGNVSALTGIANNSGVLQFTAPIGSGSSGGPILDASGAVVGLVKAVLRNDLEHAPIAQNINFGVKAGLLRSFLHAGGASPSMTAEHLTRSRAEVAKDARAYLYLVNVEF
ncbi:trypsin-like peptidase domain-containing protein [Brevundimonas diminuta]|uniref:trypsin-like peptidase domain-containing protein n=1 Tax=Brevundimonas diminuta TaxID=293 RepID=UPI001F55B86A|nr:trypsin-like peptidase domain-containing protein [Brevundimonas diminuta]